MGPWSDSLHRDHRSLIPERSLASTCRGQCAGHDLSSAGMMSAPEADPPSLGTLRDDRPQRTQGPTSPSAGQGKDAAPKGQETPPSKELETPPPEHGTRARVEQGGQAHPLQGTRASPVLAHLPRSSSASSVLTSTVTHGTCARIRGARPTQCKGTRASVTLALRPAAVLPTPRADMSHNCKLNMQCACAHVGGGPNPLSARHL